MQAGNILPSFKAKFDGHSTSEEVLRDVDLSGKRYIVTGATTGLGFYSAKMIAAKGGKVTITARSGDRARDTIKSLREELGSEIDADTFDFLVMDQMDLAQVKAAAEDFLSRNRQLDGLLLNAGWFGSEYKLSAQGYESHFAINHLSHWLFAHLLMDKLAENSTRSNPSRLVILSSESHRQPKMATINLSQLSCPKENYFSVLQYNRSKYCNVLHMHYLASKLAERHVVVHSVHPGNMVRTGIQRRWWGWKLLFALASPFTKSVSQGAATQLYALCHPTTAEFTGVYWNNCAPCEPIAPAINDDNSLQLELLSKKLCADFIQA